MSTNRVSMDMIGQTNLIISAPVAISLVRRFSLDEIPGLVDAHTVNVADLVTKLNPVAFVGGFKQLGSEGGGDELSIVGKTMDHGYRNTSTKGTSNAKCALCTTNTNDIQQL